MKVGTFKAILTKFFKIDLIIIVTIVTTFASCATQLQTTNNNGDRISLRTSDFSGLDGDYSIMSIDTARTTLLSCFIADKVFSFENLPSTNDKVNLKVLSEEKLEMTLYRDNKAVKRKIVRGQFNGDYFEFSTNHISPFWVIVNGYSNTKTRVGLLNNGNITVDTSYGRWGFLVIIPFTGARETNYNLVFARKNGSG